MHRLEKQKQVFSVFVEPHRACVAQASASTWHRSQRMKSLEAACGSKRAKLFAWCELPYVMLLDRPSKRHASCGNVCASLSTYLRLLIRRAHKCRRH